MRYLSGDLSAEEAAAFEARLADDLAAAEALSRAVLLQESLAACAADAPASALVSLPASLPGAAAGPQAEGWQRRTVVRHAALGMAAALSAAVLFAVGWFGRGALGLRSPSGSELTTATGAREDAPGGRNLHMDPLLAAWLLLADDESLPMEESALDLGVDPLGELPETSEGGVPGWMIAAVLTSADPASSPETLPAVHDPDWEEL